MTDNELIDNLRIVLIAWLRRPAEAAASDDARSFVLSGQPTAEE